MSPGNFAWGNTFEHYVILEMNRLISYSGNQFTLHFLRTYTDDEIDVVVLRPGKSVLLIEIKSAEMIEPVDVKTMKELSEIFEEPVELLCLSCDPKAQIVDGVRCLPWVDGLREYFSGPDLQL